MAVQKEGWGRLMSVPTIAVFIVMFTTALFFVNYYIVSRTVLVFGQEKAFFAIVLISAIPALMFVIATWLSRDHEGAVIKIMYVISSYWLGFAIIAFLFFMISDITALAFPQLKLKLYVVALAHAVILALFASIHAGYIKVNETTLEFGKNLTVVQISDAHYGIMHGDKYLDELVETVNGLNPDIVCFTGDLVDGSRVIHDGTFLPLKKLKAPAYFVAGNHEFYDGLERVLPAVRAGGVTVLDDSEAMEKGVRLIGARYCMKHDKTKKFLESIKAKPGLPSILLCHEPVFPEAAAKSGVNLMLSGHTHAGQIIPFNILVRTVYKHISGLYNVGEMKLFVSTGCGTWGPKMRLGSNSEINVFKLK